MSDVRVVHGDCLAALRSLPDASIDAVATDPPYGLADHRAAELIIALTAWVNGDRERVPDGKGFMGKAWDAFVPPPAVWDQCMRVLRPGGHMVVFAGSRTYDLMGLSIRLAGFEIRDGLPWLYGSGFPKGQDVGAAITKRAGLVPSEDEWPPDAVRWQGWNTSLKPAHEPIVLARKPLSGTVAATVLEHGTGALNVDGCRVAAPGESQARPRGTFPHSDDAWGDGRPNEVSVSHAAGRWPANVLLSHGPECNGQCAPGCPVAELDAQSGTSVSARSVRKPAGGELNAGGTTMGRFVATEANVGGYDDSGGASRFFPSFRYQAKASTRERPKVDGVAHPTVKPLALMAWLVRLVTPPGGTVLDPFAGSGTTLQAARAEGMASIGIERDATYLSLIAHRLGVDPDAIERDPRDFG